MLPPERSRALVDKMDALYRELHESVADARDEDGTLGKVRTYARAPHGVQRQRGTQPRDAAASCAQAPEAKGGTGPRVVAASWKERRPCARERAPRRHAR